VLRLLRRGELLAALERSGRRRGVALVRSLLRREGGPAMTRSEAERRLLGLIRKAGIPPPRTNVRIGRYEVDLLWRAERLIVEVDGYAYHSTRVAFERDRVRDAELQAAGFRVIRITWRQIVEEPLAVAARIARALAVSTAVR
jgi:very-short-patch-repair endonuclease